MSFKDRITWNDGDVEITKGSVGALQDELIKMEAEVQMFEELTAGDSRKDEMSDAELEEEALRELQEELEAVRKKPTIPKPAPPKPVGGSTRIPRI